MIVGSLFSGIGGFDLGLERAGHRVVWQVEADRQCRAVLRKHWTDVDLLEDVRDVGVANLATTDLICGGFPCQDLSVAGRRAGLDGARSGLWHEFHRIVGEMLPTWVLVENVPGLRSSAGGRDLAVILRGLAKLGYVGAWRSLDAQYFGLAQRRERIFLLACRDPRAGCPAEVLAIAESLSRHPAPGRKAGQGVAGALDARAAKDGFPGTDGASDGHVIAFDSTQVTSKDNRCQPQAGDPCNPLAAGAHAPAIAATISANGGRTYDGHEGVRNVLTHTLRAEGFDASEDGTGRGTPIWAFQDTQSGGRMGETTGTLDSNYGPRRRMGVLVATPRRLTPRECERLQGFPDDFTRYADDDRELADGPRYRMLGNAVAVPVVEWIGRKLMSTDEREVAA